MVRLRVFLCVASLALAVHVIGLLSCGRDKPTAPAGERIRSTLTITPLGDRTGGAREWYAQTSEQLDSLFDKGIPPYLLTGDTIRLKADTLFHLGEKAYPRQDSLTLLVVGDSPKPTIRSTRSSGAGALVFSADGADRRIQFRNFTIDCDSANHDQFFIKLIDYSDVLFDGIDGNLGRTNIISFADTTTIYNCDLDALRTCVDFIGIEDGGAPVYIVDGSSFRMTTDGGAAQSLLARFDGAGGTVIVKNSEFTSAHAGTRNFLECNAITGDVVGIPVTIEDNSFYNDVTLKLGGTIGGSSGVTYELTYEDNTWPTSECPPAFQIIDSVTVVADEMHWFWGGDYLSYSYIWSDIGEVEGVGHLKKYCDGTHYVSAAFDLVADTLDNFHNFTIPVVKYGFTSGTLNSTASVCWNPGVDKWYAEMDADWCTTKACTLYWEATVTECDSSGTSAEQSYIYRNDMGPCKDPLVCD